MKLSLSLSTIRQALDTLYDSAHDLGARSIGGGFAGIYAKSGSQTYGESTSDKLAASEIFIHGGGTQDAGKTFLQNYELTGDTHFLGQAVDVARALVAAQKPLGGWGDKFKAGSGLLNPEVTLDDNVTQGSLKFLMDVDRHVDAGWLDGAIQKGLDFLVKFQDDRGGWQQRYPSKGDYHDSFTFNDNAIQNTVTLLAQAHDQYGNKEYLAAAQKGADFILATQLGQGGWAQQYDHNLNPTHGRSFEPKGIASSETASIVKTLLAVYEVAPDARYLEAAQSAVDWLSKSMLPDGQWARLYEIGSNRPIYAARDGSVSYSASHGASSYRWQGDFGVHDVIQQVTLLTVAPDRYEEIYGADAGNDVRVKATTLESNAATLIKSYAKNDWLDGSYLKVGDVAANSQRLQDYLSAVHDSLEAQGQHALWQSILDGAKNGGKGLSGSIQIDYLGKVLIGKSGADKLTGTDGDDVMLGGAGKDSLTGGAGHDVLVGGAGADSLNGGDGIDRVDYSMSSEGVSVSLALGKGEKGDAAGARLANIEDVVGSRFNDTIDGDGRDNRLEGGAGDDSVSGGDGNDVLVGGSGADLLNGGAGIDRVEYSTSSAGVTVSLTTGIGENGDAAGDRLAGIEDLVGSRFNDILEGDEHDNRIEGGAGNDKLRGFDGDDLLRGGDGKDYLNGGNGHDVLTGGAGLDRFDFDKVSQTPVGELRDIITDFTPDLDLIDLRSIDADKSVAGNQAFTFIGEAAFSTMPGELHVIHDDGNTIVEGDVNGDGQADFQIQLNGMMTLHATDFLL